MSVVEKSVEVNVPVSVAYDQWTQFEEFPRFMEGVEEVRQLDDTTLSWHVSIGGVDRHFEARIEEQTPDQRIAWRATNGEDHAGVVTFQPVGADQTRVSLMMSYEPDNWTDKVADFLNIIDNRVENDLERFKGFVEERGTETGAWRGEVDSGQTRQGDPAPGTPPAPPSGTELRDAGQGGDPNLR